jgi:hypothetical protein
VRASRSVLREAGGEIPPAYSTAHLRTQPKREVHRPCADDAQAAPSEPDRSRPMVPRAPTRGGGPAAEIPQCQTPRPLPVLRTTDELPQFTAVLSGRPSSLAEVAQSSHSWEVVDVGEISRPPPSPPSVATSHHAFLGYDGEPCLRNPLREICMAEVCEGGELSGATVNLNAHEAGNDG